MRKIYFALACGVMALGLLHMAATTRLFSALTQSALWFLSGGLLMVLAGALNLLNRAYGGAAPGVRWVCVGTNAIVTLFALSAGLVGHASAGELVVIVGLMAGVAALSLLPHSVVGRPESGAA